MKNHTLEESYRRKLIGLHAFAVGVVSMLELAVYFLQISRGGEGAFEPFGYFGFRVFLPVVLNIAVHIAARHLSELPRFTHTQRNAAALYAVIATSIIVSLVHRRFVVASCAVALPMIVSAHFNERKLLVHSLVMAVLTLVVTVVTVYFENGADAVYITNFTVVCGFVAVCFFASRISMYSSELNVFVIENQAQTNRRLRNKVKKDPMTGLYNHKTFHDELALAISKAEESRKSFYVAMLDIDDFKQINDTCGHDDGDVVLSSLAGIIRHNIKSSETAFRYGGEEFALIIQRDSIDDAIGLMKKILCDLSDVTFGFRKEPVTFSCGLATFMCGMTKAQIFDSADDGMYVAKKNGKNRIYCCEKNEFV